MPSATQRHVKIDGAGSTAGVGTAGAIFFVEGPNNYLAEDAPNLNWDANTLTLNVASINVAGAGTIKGSLNVYGPPAGAGDRFQIAPNAAGNGTDLASLNNVGSDFDILTLTSNTLAIKTRTTLGASIEVARFTSSAAGGYFKTTDDATYNGAAAAYHELRSSNANDTVVVSNKHAVTPFGISLKFAAAAPNNAAQYFFSGTDTVGEKITGLANGGLRSFSANNVNLSDLRVKKNITPLESYWEKFKQIEIVKYQYQDQDHDGFNIGVVAQQVEAVAPEFVDDSGWHHELGKFTSPLKAVFDGDIHYASIGVIKELIARVEKLEARVFI